MGYKMMSGARQIDSLDAADASLAPLPLDLGAAFTSPLRRSVPTVEEKAATVKVSRMRESMPTRFGPAAVIPRKSMPVMSMPSMAKGRRRERVPFWALNKKQQKKVLAKKKAMRIKAARAEGEVGAAKRIGVPPGIEAAMIIGTALRPTAYPVRKIPAQPAPYRPYRTTAQAAAANAARNATRLRSVYWGNRKQVTKPYKPFEVNRRDRKFFEAQAKMRRMRGAIRAAGISQMR